MTSPMVDRVIKIPLIVEKDVSLPVVNDEMDVDSGFPFDRTPNRSNQILEDLANRHPELAEHFENFGSNRRVPRTTTTTNTDRPFGSRFERFSGFPFDSHRDLFDDDYDDDFERNHRQQQEKSQPKQESQQQQQPESKQECSASDNSSDPTRQRSRKQQNIQQSNTVDLGQKQELVNDRNQRSMSAPPPDNRPRFVSSINIPINRDEQPPQQQQPTQQQQQQKENTTTTQPNRPTERVIPIHVEGRDEPIIPKNVGHSFSNQQTHYQQQQSPQPERIFGQRPSQFTQFLNREPPQRPFSGQRQFDDGFRQPHFQQQQQQPQFQQQQQQYQQQQQEKFEQQKQEQQQVPQQQQQQKVPPSPIDTIQLIQKDVSALMSQVEQFSGKPKDKQYLYLDEMLTRNLIKLDNIDTQGQENIRQARKEAIKCIEKCISILEAKAAANAQQEQQQQTEQKEEYQPKEEVQEQQQMEVEQEKQPEVKPEIEVAEENKNDPQVATITNEECSKSEEKMEAVPVVGNVEKELMEIAPISPPQIETMETEQTPQSQNPEIEIKPEIAEDKKEEEIKEPEEKITETEQEEEVETKQEEKKEKKKGKKKEATKKQTS